MRLSLLVLTAVVVACTPITDQQNPDRAAVIGSEADQRAVAGLWRGAFDAVDDRLDGPLEFRMAPGAVLFTSSSRGPRHILWFRITGEHLSGAMETWFDPERKADVYTTFEATVRDGAMSGTVREKIGMEWRDVGTFTASRVSD
jgi:hypothetical protein